MTMTIEELEFTTLEIVAYAGDARSKYIQALNFANEGKFDEAENLIKEASEFIDEAHKTQTKIFNNNIKIKGKEETLKYSAPPGASEHETGFAIDILSENYSKLDSGFENTKEFKWLKENCYKYGFIIRYPKQKTNITKYSYEPWHYRYVGVSHATKIMNENICLEEYLEDLDNEINLLEISLAKNISDINAIK